MSKFFAIIAFAVALPMSNPAHAYIKCDKKADAKAKKKCEKNMAKSIAKQRKGSTALKPSQLGDEFAFLDENNPFDTDDWYVGVSKIGVKKIDKLSMKVAKMSATVRLAKYTGYINKTDKAAASKLGGILLPKLQALQEDGQKLVEEIQGLVADPAALVQENPTAALKIPGALGKLATNSVKAVGDIPGALTAVVPIAGGAAAGAIAGAAAKVGDAADQATGAVNDAKEAAADVKEAAGN